LPWGIPTSSKGMAQRPPASEREPRYLPVSRPAGADDLRAHGNDVEGRGEGAGVHARTSGLGCSRRRRIRPKGDAGSGLERYGPELHAAGDIPGLAQFVDRPWSGAHANRGADDRARSGMPTGAMGYFPGKVLWVSAWEADELVGRPRRPARGSLGGADGQVRAVALGAAHQAAAGAVGNAGVAPDGSGAGRHQALRSIRRHRHRLVLPPGTDRGPPGGRMIRSISIRTSSRKPLAAE